MQINELKNLMLAGANNQINQQISQNGKLQSDESVRGSEPLRSISLKNPFYDKNELNQNTVAGKFEEAAQSGLDAKELKEQMVLNAEHMTTSEYDALKEKGYDPMDMDARDYVTIADKIRVQLAKGGMDISLTGGLSKEAAEVIGGDTLSAGNIENAVEKSTEASVDVTSAESDSLADSSDSFLTLPEGTWDKSLQKDVDNAMKKAAELSDLSEDNILYLVKNQMEPTIDNLFAAEYSQGQSAKNPAETSAIDFSNPDMAGLMEQVSSVITEAGFTVDELQLENAAKLIGNEIPVTKETIGYYNTLQNQPLKLESDEVKQAVLTAVEEGQMPKDAYLMEGFSLYDKAVSVDAYFRETSTEEIVSASVMEDGVAAQRQVAEIRLMMTVEANYSMLKNGITLDTTDLEALVENLKQQEAHATLEAKVSEVMETKEEVLSYPIDLLGGFHSKDEVDAATITSLQTTGAAFKAKYDVAAVRYETMQTEVRRDLGDSIKKAFQNVDDILEDMGLEATVANERAVRILGYNSLEITEENVSLMKYADETVQTAMKSLTPKVVTEMIKTGYNPLDMPLEEVIKKAKSLSSETEGNTGEDTGNQSQNQTTDDSENYAEFLWKLERQKGITEEQRQSFIGVYRLLHQVEATDGAVIGQLIHQGAELTLRNMMGAVRTRKNENRDYTIDDDFGGVDSVTTSLSITQQIEAAFFTMRSQDANKAISPSKMTQFQNEDAYMSMNPDQFASALENMKGDEVEEIAYSQEEIERLQQAVTSEEKVYQMLQQMDFPTTPAYLEAWSQYLNNRNQMFKNLAKNLNPEREAFSEIGSDLDFDDLDFALQTTMEDIIEAMGEASKTPEEMAEAQEKLAETAENVMRNMLVEKDVSSIDVRGMKITVKQLQMLGQKAKETEQFAIPIMVADEYGNMTLKIVRGKDEDKGQVDIAFDMESTGAVSASFKYEGNSLDGTLTTSSQATRELLSARMGELASALQSAAEMPVSLSFGWEETVDANAIYEKTEYEFETTTEHREIQTTKLYGIARAFINTLGEIAA